SSRTAHWREEFLLANTKLATWLRQAVEGPPIQSGLRAANSTGKIQPMLRRLRVCKNSRRREVNQWGKLPLLGSSRTQQLPHVSSEQSQNSSLKSMWQRPN